MENKNTTGINSYLDLLLQHGNLLNSLYKDIKDKYADYPHCEIIYVENGIEDKLIEIRFDKKEITITYSFDQDDVCDCIVFAPDKKETSNELIDYLGKAFNYDFVNAIWNGPNYYVKIKRFDLLINDVCFMVTHEV